MIIKLLNLNDHSRPYKGSFINDVMKVGGGGCQFCDSIYEMKVKQPFLCERGEGQVRKS